MSLAAAERETVVTFNDEDKTAHVWTAQRPVITRLKKNPSAALLEGGKHDGTAWAEFELPAALVSFRSKRVKRELSVKQCAEVATRLAKARSHRPRNVLSAVEN